MCWGVAETAGLRQPLHPPQAVPAPRCCWPRQQRQPRRPQRRQRLLQLLPQQLRQQAQQCPAAQCNRVCGQTRGQYSSGHSITVLNRCDHTWCLQACNTLPLIHCCAMQHAHWHNRPSLATCILAAMLRRTTKPASHMHQPGLSTTKPHLTRLRSINPSPVAFQPLHKDLG